MESLISGIASGVGSVISKIFGSPLDFLSGKSCSSVCAPTWDFICYIENFCVSQLFKFAMVALLLYCVLFFFYLLYQLGICKCICWTSCKIVWGCISVYVSVWEYCCYFLFDKLRHVKRISRRRRRRDVEGQYYASSSDEVEEESSSSTCNDEVSRIEKKRRHRRDYKRDHVTRSLRPRSHRVRVGVNENSGYITRNNSSKHWDDHDSSVHSIRVAQTSKFARKGSSFKGSKHRKRR
ncbi:hypothetical protein DCAR_0103778 [Daucus carota subsp. sativus]|uniref:Uncharacterized protein n=1 Tax=Daucus carota subsp. sativus TaxID=79200 RepID=A0AAF0W8V9_DAUCS|nr:PREDICTED: uncharacterized protein LOC108199631 [Daucus carota subsp. sativus]WOG84594.1 hypothetical protein DCAR_0103778 [Daucus carota subsp. sativus]